MKNRRSRHKNPRLTVIFLLMVMSMTLLSACGFGKAEEIPEEKLGFPDSQEVINNLEENNYEVETFETFEDLGIQTTRIKAVKGEEYLDVCYDVASDDDINRIIEYYSDNYVNYNLISNVDIVICYSSESVVKDAGLSIEDLENT